MKEILIKVDGMVCGGCENRVKNALKTINGVKDASADFKTKTVIVVAEDDVLESSLNEKIEDIGYDILKKD